MASAWHKPFQRKPNRGRGGRAVGGSPGAATSTWDPANLATGATLSGSNLTLTHPPAAGGTGGSRGTTAYTSGDRYFEVTVATAATELIIGIARADAGVVNPPGTTAASYGYYAPLGRGYTGGAFTFTGATYTVGDVIGVRYDGTTLTFYKNGVVQGTATPGYANPYPQAGTALGATPRPVSILNTGGSAFSFLPSGASAWG